MPLEVVSDDDWLHTDVGRDSNVDWSPNHVNTHNAQCDVSKFGQNSDSQSDWLPFFDTTP